MAESSKEYSETLIQELERDRAFLTAILESFPGSIFLKDAQSRFIAANREIAEVMRAGDPRNLVGKTDHDFYPKEQADEYLAAERAVIEKKTAHVGSLVAKPLRGQLHWRRVTKWPVLDRAGNVIGVLGITQDLTEQRHQEAVMQNERNLLRTIIELVPDSIYAKDAALRKTMSNKGDVRILRAGSEAEVLGKSDAEFYTEDVAASFRADDLSVIETGRSILAREEYYLAEDGRRRWLLTSKVPLRNASGEIVGLVGVGRDITERKAAEEKIREQAQLLDIAADAIVVRDMSNRIRYWNKSAEACYGWTAGEAIGKNADHLLYSRVPDESAAALKTVLERGVWMGDIHFSTKDGRSGLSAARWNLVRDEKGNPRSVLCVLTDVTEKRAIQAQLLRAQRLESLGRLAGGIAHDLNNVLTPILMGLESLAPFPTDLEDYSAMLDSLKASVRRGASIVKQVLGFARGVEAGERSTIYLNPLLEELETIVGETLPKNMELRMEDPERLWPITANPTQIHQVLMNLYVNARDAMPNGGTLTIAAENVRLDEASARLHIDAKPIDYVMLSVDDTGVGMTFETMEKVFDPFFTTKDAGKGTGLGLSTALSIVKSHGGFITVCSELGKGSSFKVYLPAAATTAAEEIEEAPHPLPAGNGELILIVDDERPVREIVAKILESHGYRVAIAEDGTSALARFVELRTEIRAVLVDMIMPYMDGAATIRALRKLDPHLRIIATSGLMTDGSLTSDPELSTNAFLSKPYTTEALLRVLHDVVA